MKYVFGPVPSRRLGRSLGIDPIPLKTCNWNCVYCQLGRTIPLTNRRCEYIPRRLILSEIEKALKKHKPGDIDWITFVGSGEPTLHSGLGWLIRQIKARTSLPVAVITNGALLYSPDVQEEISAADAVLPSLDAGNRRLYRKINRPWPKLKFELVIEGMKTFRKLYSGKLWVEVMLVKGLNDTEQALQEIANVLDQMKPDQVHINLPSRPPAESWVRPADPSSLTQAIKLFGNISKVVSPAKGDFDLGSGDNLLEAIIGIITRHPMQEKELLAALEKWSPGEVEKTLATLTSSGQAQVVERYGTRFWSAVDAHFNNINKVNQRDGQR